MTTNIKPPRNDPANTRETDTRDIDPRVTPAYLAFDTDIHILGSRKPKTLVEADHIIRAGIPAELAEGIAALPCLQNDQHFLTVFGIQRSTYRSYLQAGICLSKKSSSRIWSFATILGRLENALDSRDAAQYWLITANDRISGKFPLDLLSTSAGTKCVEECIDDIENEKIRNHAFPADP